MYWLLRRKRKWQKKKKEKSSVRNDWIPSTWRYNGAGFSKDKKKESKRGYQKHKKKDYSE